MVLCGSERGIGFDKTKHVGIGFANLIERKKPVEGHAMIEVQSENLNEIVVEFYKYGQGQRQVEVDSITVTLECTKKKDSYPLHSYSKDSASLTPQPPIPHYDEHPIQ